MRNKPVPYKNLVYVCSVGLDGVDETGRIALTESAQEANAQKGIVMAVGPKTDTNLKEGDQVIYCWYNSFRRIRAQEYFDTEKDLLCIPSRHILAVLFGDNVEDARPLNDYVLAVWEEARPEEKGIIIPESATARHYTAIVRAVGPEVREISPGDRVFFDQFGKINKFTDSRKGESIRFAVMRESAIIAKVPLREELANV